MTIALNLIEVHIDYAASKLKDSKMTNKNLANLILVVFICVFVSSKICLTMAGNDTIDVNVGVILDDLDSMEGKAWLS